jgi:DNA-damage-inducible protein J
MNNTITVRVDTSTKENANKVFKEVGIDMSTAINMFLKQVIMTNGIPFMITAAKPNETTLNAIKQIEQNEYESFSSIDELMEDLND